MLIQKTGVPRSTIHFYVRTGLLPKPQKAITGRSLYTDGHVRLLQEIQKLKDAGLSLAEIRSALEEDLARAQEDKVDLAQREYERVHRAILHLATKQFAAKGYKGVQVAGITRALGITPQVFYNHFPSKLQLFVESFHTFLEWNLAFVEPRLAQSSDAGERLLWRLLADARATRFGAEVISQVRSETGSSDSEKQQLTEQAWQSVIRYMVAEFETLRPAGSPSPIPLELLAYSMLGAHHNASMRASWGEEYSREDVLRTHLWLWLAAMAAMSLEVDVESRLPRYEDLIREMARREPETPPAPDDEVADAGESR